MSGVAVQAKELRYEVDLTGGGERTEEERVALQVSP